MQAIELRELSKSYPPQGSGSNPLEALCNVSLRLRQGEVSALLGPNGAGKSTLIRILATLTRPSSGEASVAGRSVAAEPHAVRRAVGYVPQASGADRTATPRENLRFQGRLFRLRRPQLESRVDAMIELFGLDEVGDRRVSVLSGGTVRRLDLAMALLHEPSVLLLDEPTTGLDPEARGRLWGELAQLVSGRELTILLATHYLEEADRLASQVEIIERGRIVASGAPSKLKAALHGDQVSVSLQDGGEGARAIEVLARRASEPYEPTLEGRLLRLRAQDATRALPRIVAALEAEGISVAEATLRRPSLEDVYLAVTGHQFRVNPGPPSTAVEERAVDELRA